MNRLFTTIYGIITELQSAYFLWTSYSLQPLLNHFHAGGGSTARMYAIRQALSKSLVAYYQKFVDETSKKEIKDILLNYDKTLLVADPRRCEPKKFGGPGARAKYQKSYR